MSRLGALRRRRPVPTRVVGAGHPRPEPELSPEELYRTQPHLRAVISLVARNVAQLGLKVYARDSDTNRVRLSDDPLALLLKRPNPYHTTFELIEWLVSDLALWDTAYWLVAPATTRSGWMILPITPTWVIDRHTVSNGFSETVTAYTVENPDGERIEIPAENLLAFHGWNPGKPNDGASPVDALRNTLEEQRQAWSYREQSWKRGGRVSAAITRPKDAPWSDTARQRFAAEWAARWTGADGDRAGGTPILEDGMTINSLGFSAREEEWSEVSKLSLATVASAYHVPPSLVGLLDDANFSNAREQHKMFYAETLGPILAMLEDRINVFLAPRVAATPDAYVEFNLEEKLQGSFSEQAQVFSASAGAPWMTVNEARALMNLTRIEGGDELVTPLNLATGAHAAPDGEH